MEIIPPKLTGPMLKLVIDIPYVNCVFVFLLRIKIALCVISDWESLTGF